MVARILTGKSIRGLIHYNESKVDLGTANLILANRFGLDIEQLKLRHKVTRFEHLTKLNSRIKTNAVHIMLNFDPSEKMADGKLQEITVEYMEQIGFGDQPFLAYRHQDTAHPHIHVVTTNVKADASRINMQNIGKTLSETARRNIEKKFGLVKAEGKNQSLETISPVIINAIYGERSTKSSIYNIVTAVTRDYAFTSFSEFNAILNAFNVNAERGTNDTIMFQKRGLIYSIIDQSGKRIGIPFKASALPGRPTLDRIERKYARNKLKRQASSESLKQRILDVVHKQPILDKDLFRERLAAEGIAVLFRENQQRQIFGITYIDDKSRTVFNGSDLGKVFSAKAILGRFKDRQLHYNTQGDSIFVQGTYKGKIKKIDSDQIFHLDRSAKIIDSLFMKPEYQQAISSQFATSKKRKKKKSKSIQFKNQF